MFKIYTDECYKNERIFDICSRPNAPLNCHMYADTYAPPPPPLHKLSTEVFQMSLYYTEFFSQSTCSSWGPGSSSLCE